MTAGVFERGGFGVGVCELETPGARCLGLQTVDRQVGFESGEEQVEEY